MQDILKLISQAHLARFQKLETMASVIHVLATVRSYSRYDWLLQLRFRPNSQEICRIRWQ